MKSISAPAMAAIEAGEAIVTGAVEINGTANGSWSFDTAPWRYLREAYTSTNSYEDPDFDDSGWSEDFLPFGNSAMPIAVSSGFRSPPIGVVALDECLHLRRTLTLDAEISALNIGVFADNGWALWVNGVEVASESDEFFVVNTYSIDGSYFTVGDNSLYIKVVDDGPHGGSDNFYFDLKRRILTPALVTPMRVWGGYGSIEIDGETYQGVGERGLAQQTAGAIGGVAQGLALTVSGIEPALLELLDDVENFKGASVVLRRLIFASDGKTLLDAHVFDRGRLDAIDSDETIGAGAAIKASVESAARGLGRAGARQRSDSDQRLINPSDGYFKNAAYAVEKALYWGGKRPTRVGSTV